MSNTPITGNHGEIIPMSPVEGKSIGNKLKTLRIVKFVRTTKTTNKINKILLKPENAGIFSRNLSKPLNFILLHLNSKIYIGALLFKFINLPLSL